MKRLFIIFIIAVASSFTAFGQHPQPSYSYLEIFDVETGTHKVVKSFPYVIEAPNWTPDGKWLIVNKDGRLFKLAPDGSTDLQEIDTGSIVQWHNDHVVTADGRWRRLSRNDPANVRS